MEKSTSSIQEQETKNKAPNFSLDSKSRVSLGNFMKKGFIFSIDAFISFTIILVLIHSLVFIATIPSSYYSSLMQANYLAQDSLDALANANMSKMYGLPGDETVLEYLMKNRQDEDVIRGHIGALIPVQYGYRLELWNSSTNSWTEIYDTKNYSISDDPHNKLYRKLKVSAYSLSLGTDIERGGKDSPFCYITCNSTKYGNYGNCPTQCDKPKSLYEKGSAILGLLRLTVYR